MKPLHHLIKPSLPALLGVLALAGCAIAPPQVPDNLRTPPAQQVNLIAYAQGVQIYTCGPAQDRPGQYAWNFKAPEATLADRSGNTIGRHYAGPTWESPDGSKVVGQVVASNPGTDANAIPWLLLSAKSVSGNGVFTRTQSVQRIQTVAGKAPAGGCANAADAGKEARVPYQAIYYFYNGTA
jgi:hypothetical protein